LSPRLEALRRQLAAYERSRDDLLMSDDMAMVTGAYERADAMVREVQQLLAAELARIEPIARDAMAGGAA
jgi:hypothetical protein